MEVAGIQVRVDDLELGLIPFTTPDSHFSFVLSLHLLLALPKLQVLLYRVYLWLCQIVMPKTPRSRQRPARGRPARVSPTLVDPAKSPSQPRENLVAPSENTSNPEGGPMALVLYGNVPPTNWNDPVDAPTVPSTGSLKTRHIVYRKVEGERISRQHHDLQVVVVRVL